MKNEQYIYINSLYVCIRNVHYHTRNNKIKHVSALMNEYLLIRCSLNQEGVRTYTVMDNYLGESSQYHVESIFFVNVNNQKEAPVPIDDFNNDGINPL
jgi:hypothetical protein